METLTHLIILGLKIYSIMQTLYIAGIMRDNWRYGWKTYMFQGYRDVLAYSLSLASWFV